VHGDGAGGIVNTQLKKGLLDLLVLAMIEHTDRYGFELVERVSRHVEIAERTIYPLLKRLRDDGLVTTYLQESAMGAPRKYYRLSDKGKEYLATAKAEWKEMRAAVDGLLEEAEREQG
jgi:PadR family transcriptional regulator PadR